MTTVFPCPASSAQAASDPITGGEEWGLVKQQGGLPGFTAWPTSAH